MPPASSALWRHGAPRLVVVVLVLALALGGCSTAPTGRETATRAATPTSTPSAPVLRELPIPGFSASKVIPGAAGLALLSAGATSAGASELAFYRFSDSSVTPIWTATNGSDGTPNNVIAAAYEGSRIIFETSTARASDWVIWSYDDSTGQRSQLLSDTEYPDSGTVFWVAGPSDLLWTSVTSGGPYGVINQLMDYSYATGQSRVLYSNPSALITPLAVNSNEAMYMLEDVSASPPTVMAQWLSQTAPTQLSQGRAGSGSMTETYAAWDDIRAQTASAYVVNTGQLAQNIAPCVDPALDDAGPYMVCVAAGGGAYLLIHLLDGGKLPFGAGMAIEGGAGIYHGRGYIAGPDGAVYMFDLPAR